MKKLSLAILLAATLTGCNADISLGSYSYHYAHIQMYGMETPIHLQVVTWKSDAGGVELRVKFNDKETTMLAGDGTYLLYDTAECPTCGHVEYR